MELAGHDLTHYPDPLEDHLKKNWSDFQTACEQACLQAPLTTFSNNFLLQLEKAWIGSDFVFEQSLKHPELIFQFFTNSTLLQNFQPETHHHHLEELVDSCSNEQELIQKLRIYRNQEMVRIIWRDLNRIASMEETTLDLSDMADACVDKSLEWLYTDACNTFGIPMDKQYGEQPKPQKMIVLAMGKLGAHELNLSSDIDLMFSFPGKGETVGGRRAIDNQEFFTRLGQQLIKVLDSKTADGFVFRVDMRLRPYGSSGALVMSFSAMEQYYQDQGRNWERYAMIKARAIAGDIHEGQLLLNTLRPFTFRRYLDFSAISSLRDMKALIQREVKRKGMQGNIKLGPGGIREIEFIAQSFQLIHGGRDRVLQEKQLLKVLWHLKQHNYLPDDAVGELTAAYIYLRNLEHGIQALQDKQTQQLPLDNFTLDRLSFSMGHQDWNETLTVLDHYRNQVMTHFNNVIEESESSPEPTKAANSWNLLWSDRLEKEDALELFSDKGFQNPEESLKLILSLRDGKAITRVRRQSRERLDKFIPQLLEQIPKSSQPDIALMRLIPLVEHVLRRTAYLVLLMENPKAQEHLIKLCTASPWIAAQIARYPALLDEFLNISDLYNPPKQDELRDDLRQQLAHIPEDDLEAQMEVLRHFKMAHVLKVAAAQVVGTLPLMKESDYLTWLAEVLLGQVVSIAWRSLIERHGRPPSTDNTITEPGFIVVGYGKLGGIELGPSSDLDLVFIHNGNPAQETDGARPLDSQTFYTRLGQRIIHIITTQTTSGRLYEVDMRLRPSGTSGLLVTSFSAFEKYQLNDAWTWEHQALVRARAVTGDHRLMKKFEALRKQILTTRRDPHQLKESVINMRQKMSKHLFSTQHNDEGEPMFHLKHHDGGIVDIEFLMQFAVLANAHDHPEIIDFTDNISISKSLEKAKLISPENAHELREAYKFLRKATHSRSFQNEQSFVDHNVVEPYRSRIQTLWQEWMNLTD